MSFFQPISKSVDVKRSDRVRDPLIYRNCEEGDEAFTILIDRPVTKAIAEKIDHMIQNSLTRKVNFQLVSVLPFIPIEKELKKDLIWFYADNRIDLSKYLRPNMKVVTIGRALYSITRSDDLKPEYFYDFIFNETHFYAPEFGVHVFPVDNYKTWIPEKFSKEFERQFALLQFKRAYEYHPRPVRDIRTTHVEVEDVESFLREHMDEKIVSWDTETDGLDYFTCTVGCVTLSFDGRTGYYFDWDDKYIPIFRDFLRDKFQIGANLKFDIKLMWRKGVDTAKVDFDVWQAGHICNEMRSQSLKTLTWIYTRNGGYDFELEAYKRRYRAAQTNYLKIPKPIRMPYAIDDAIFTYQVYEKLNRQIDDIDRQYPLDTGWSLRRYFEEIMIPAVNMYAEMELEGVYVNWDRVTEVSNELHAEIQKVREEIYKVFGVSKRELDLDSPQKLGLFLEEIGWEVVERAKGKYYLTNDACLDAWSKMGHKEAELLQKYRELNTLQGTFVGYEKGPKGESTGIWQYRRIDNKVHPDFFVMVKNSGRNGSANPNFQNCFSSDTEILTEGGWVKFESLPKGLKVAQYDENTNKISFVEPLAYIEKDWNGELVNIKTEKQIDMFVTPDHECLIQNRKTDEFKKILASEYPSDYRQIQAGEYVGGTGLEHLTKDHLVLICATQADAYIYQSDRMVNKGIEFVFSKKRKADRLILSLNNIGVEYNLSIKKSGQYRIYLKSGDFANWLSDFKTFGPWLMNLNREQIEFLSEEVFNWDGLFTRRTNYASSEKINADWIQIVFTLTNKRGRIREYWNKNPNSKISYQVDISRNRNYSLTSNRELEYIPYNGKVYCVTVPSGNIITRRNNKVAITGNCPSHGDWAEKYRSFFAAPSNDWYIADVDYSGFQLRIGAIYSQDSMMKRIFTELAGDMHSITAQQILQRDATLEEFLKHKKDKYSEVRFKAKAINFGFEFGSTAYAFAKQTLQQEWTLDEAKEYVIKNNLQQTHKYIHNLCNTNNETDAFSYFWTCSIDIRKKFFETYGGLEKWILGTYREANQKGYVRSPFGAFRRLPQLFFCDGIPGEKGKKISSKSKNLYNISLNSPVQNFEVAVITIGMIAAHKQMKTMKSRFFGMTHDSASIYIYKPEVDIMKDIIKGEFEKHRDLYGEIPILTEGELADPEKGEVWHFGESWW